LATRSATSRPSAISHQPSAKSGRKRIAESRQPKRGIKRSACRCKAAYSKSPPAEEFSSARGLFYCPNKMVGDCPDFAQSAEHNGTVPFSEAPAATAHLAHSNMYRISGRSFAHLQFRPADGHFAPPKPNNVPSPGRNAEHNAPPPPPNHVPPNNLRTPGGAKSNA
jgi:hypothetical protein